MAQDTGSLVVLTLDGTALLGDEEANCEISAEVVSRKSKASRYVMNTTGTKSCKISGSGGVEVDAGYATLVSAMNDGTAVPLVYTGSAFVVTGDFVLESIKSSGKNDDNETYEYSFVNEGEFTVEAA
jgi:hypothetical protein